MEKIAFNIHIDDDYREILIAELLDMDFDSFEELDNKLIAYIEVNRISDVNREHIEYLLDRYPGDNYIILEKMVDEKNWNEFWEQSIEPVSVGAFWIQPTWWHKSPPANKIVLMIDPKMAFGTGYHETTRLMLRALTNVISGGEKVLDVGTGTGILTIASLKLGAFSATGLDVDEWSYQNALENIYINEVKHKADIVLGSIDTLNSKEIYDIILANINRNTIQKLAPVLMKHLCKNTGRLLLSGLLRKDFEAIGQIEAFNPLKLAQTFEEGEWMALQYEY